MKNILLILILSCVNRNAKEDINRMPLADIQVDNFNIKMAIQNGENLNEIRNNGKIRLTYSSEINNIEGVEQLLNNGALVDKKDKFQDSALIIASRKDHQYLVSYLIEKGADLDIKCQNKNTALIISCSRGYYGIVKALIEGGCNLNSRNRKNENALSIALRNKHAAIAAMIIEEDTLIIENHEINNLAFLALSLSIHDIKITLKILEKLSSDDDMINVKNINGDTLISLCLNNLLNTSLQEEDINRLRDFIAKVILNTPSKDLSLRDSRNETPLMIASKLADIEFVSSLLFLGGNINEKNGNMTPMRYALTNSDVEKVKNFIKIISSGAYLDGAPSQTSYEKYNFLDSKDIIYFLSNIDSPEFSTLVTYVESMKDYLYYLREGLLNDTITLDMKMHVKLYYMLHSPDNLIVQAENNQIKLEVRKIYRELILEILRTLIIVSNKYYDIKKQGSNFLKSYLSSIGYSGNNINEYSTFEENLKNFEVYKNDITEIINGLDAIESIDNRDFLVEHIFKFIKR